MSICYSVTVKTRSVNTMSPLNLNWHEFELYHSFFLGFQTDMLLFFFGGGEKNFSCETGVSFNHSWNLLPTEFRS